MDEVFTVDREGFVGHLEKEGVLYANPFAQLSLSPGEYRSGPSFYTAYEEQRAAMAAYLAATPEAITIDCQGIVATAVPYRKA